MCDDKILSEQVASKFGIDEFGNNTILAYDSIRCFELSVKYRLDVTYTNDSVLVFTHSQPTRYTQEGFKFHDDDPIKATRVAILKTLLKTEDK
jgi:hypothetical protein